jgi:hypothetical protein
MRLKTHVKRVFHWAKLFERNDFVGIALSVVMSNCDKGQSNCERKLSGFFPCTSRDFLRIFLSHQNGVTVAASLHGDNPSRINQPSTK